MTLKTPFYSKSGVVMAERPLASVIGLETLKRGGNAIDAPAAISFALAVTQPQLDGLGGAGCPWGSYGVAESQVRDPPSAGSRRDPQPP